MLAKNQNVSYAYFQMKKFLITIPGFEQSGHAGTCRSKTPFFGQLWFSYRKWSEQNTVLHPLHFIGKKSNRLQSVNPQCRPKSGSSM